MSDSSTNVKNTNPHDPTSYPTKRPSRRVLFPKILYGMLEDAESQGFDDVVSWGKSGRCFKVHDKRRFLRDVLPWYLRLKQYKSFVRQLNLWGFSAIRGSRKVPERGSYFHAHFIRGRTDLCTEIANCKERAVAIGASTDRPPLALSAAAEEHDNDECTSTTAKANDTTEASPSSKTELVEDARIDKSAPKEQPRPQPHSQPHSHSQSQQSITTSDPILISPNTREDPQPPSTTLIAGASADSEDAARSSHAEYRDSPHNFFGSMDSNDTTAVISSEEGTREPANVAAFDDMNLDIFSYASPPCASTPQRSSMAPPQVPTGNSLSTASHAESSAASSQMATPTTVLAPTTTDHAHVESKGQCKPKHTFPDSNTFSVEDFLDREIKYMHHENSAPVVASSAPLENDSTHNEKNAEMMENNAADSFFMPLQSPPPLPSARMAENFAYYDPNRIGAEQSFRQFFSNHGAMFPSAAPPIVLNNNNAQPSAFSRIITPHSERPTVSFDSFCAQEEANERNFGAYEI